MNKEQTKEKKGEGKRSKGIYNKRSGLSKKTFHHKYLNAHILKISMFDTILPY